MNMKPETAASAGIALSNSCKQCGSPLLGTYCSDQTCCYNDWPQAVERKDLSVFSTEEVEAKYAVQKRKADTPTMASPAAAIAHKAGKALEQAYPFGYRSAEHNSP